MLHLLTFPPWAGGGGRNSLVETCWDKEQLGIYLHPHLGLVVELDDLPDLEEAGGHQVGDCVLSGVVGQRDQLFGVVRTRGQTIVRGS